MNLFSNRFFPLVVLLCITQANHAMEEGYNPRLSHQYIQENNNFLQPKKYICCRICKSKPMTQSWYNGGHKHTKRHIRNQKTVKEKIMRALATARPPSRRTHRTRYLVD